MNNILIVPDAYARMKSGAIVARTVAKWLVELGYHVSATAPDIMSDDTTAFIHLYKCKSYRAIANHREKEYLPAFKHILDSEKIEAVIFLGSITNKNICYYEECFRRKLITIDLIFMQDFFCMRQYANSLYKQCTKCLDNPFAVYCCKNGIDGSMLPLKKTLYLETSYKIRKIMTKLDAVIGSTEEQLHFYKKCGVSSEKCVNLPLPFDTSRICPNDSVMGDYFMCIAQDRSEKGFQFIPEILKHCNSGVKIILAYDGEMKAKAAIQKFGFEPYIKSGMLIVEYDKQWTTGLYELLANSRGVIIPSIWHTTTEYGLLEALGLKKPTFTFDISCHHEFIQNGVNGFKAPLGDGRKIAEAINEVYKNDSLYRSISEGAYSLYIELTSENKWKKFLKEIL